MWLLTVGTIWSDEIANNLVICLFFVKFLL